MARDELRKIAEKNTKTARKQNELDKETERKSIATKIQQKSAPLENGEPSMPVDRRQGDELGEEEVEPYPTEWEVVKKKMVYSDFGTDGGEKGGES